MKKGGLTAARVEAKLHETMGNFAAVARHFGVSRAAVWRFVHARPTLLAIANDVREEMKDNTESRLYSDCLKDNAVYQTSRIFFLKTQAKDRGYIERAELNLRNLDDDELATFHRLYNKAAGGT